MSAIFHESGTNALTGIGINTKTDVAPKGITEVSGYNTYKYSMCSGQTIPHFHLRKKRGDLLRHTPWSQYYGDMSFTGSWGYNSKYGGYDRSDNRNLLDGVVRPSCVVSPSEIHYVLSDLDTDYLVQLAAARIYDRSWDALTFAAELNKTIALFVRTLSRILHYIRTGQLEKLWLEGRYGWRLILYDIEDINKLLSNLDDQRKRFNERVGRSDTIQTSDSYLINFYSQDFDIVWNTVYDISSRGHVVADIKPPKISFDPIKTTWELIPFSFVIDWVLSVGSALSSMAFVILSTNYSAAGGFHVTATRTWSYENSRNWETSFVSSAWATAEGEFVAKYTVRNPCSVPYFPQLRLNFDVYKIADLIALIVQALRR